MDEQRPPHLERKGDKLWVHWGRFGLCLCMVHHIGKTGKVYAVRWNKRWREWTRSPRPVQKVPMTSADKYQQWKLAD